MKMTLPERQEFDLESAAAYLGCTTSDILYYLDKGLLRLAVSADPSFPEFFCVPFEKLSTEQRQTLQLLYNPDGIELQQVMLDLVPSSLKPYIAPYTAPLYLSQYQRNQIKYTRHELGEAIWILENFRGEQLTIWLEGRLWGYWLKEENGWIADTCLAREELDKIKAEQQLPDLPFKLPKKPNEVSIVMVDYGNRFFEENGRPPIPTELINFLLLHSEKIGFRIRTDDEMKNGTGDAKKKYNFNGKGVSERRFFERFTDYTKRVNNE
jgi:hypothetical protein